MRCFCIQENYKNLFAKDANSDGLTHLYPLKVIAITMIVTDHTYGTTISGMLYDTRVAELVS